MPQSNTKFAVMVDNSNPSVAAVEAGLKLVKEGDELNIVHATETDSPGEYALDLADEGFAGHYGGKAFEEYNKAIEDHAHMLVDSFVKQAETKGVKCSGYVLKDRSKSGKDQAVDWLKKNQVDTVVVGNRKMGALGRFFLGSFSEYLLNHSDCDVHVVRCHVDQPEAEFGVFPEDQTAE